MSDGSARGAVRRLLGGTGRFFGGSSVSPPPVKPSSDIDPDAEAAREPFGLRTVRRWIAQRFASSLTRRIVVLNLAGLIALLIGFLYLNQFRQGLIEARVQSLLTQGDIIAGAIAASATVDTRRDHHRSRPAAPAPGRRGRHLRRRGALGPRILPQPGAGGPAPAPPDHADRDPRPGLRPRRHDADRFARALHPGRPQPRSAAGAQGAPEPDRAGLERRADPCAGSRPALDRRRAGPGGRAHPAGGPARAGRRPAAPWCAATARARPSCPWRCRSSAAAPCAAPCCSRPRKATSTRSSRRNASRCSRSSSSRRS